MFLFRCYIQKSFTHKTISSTWYARVLVARIIFFRIKSFIFTLNVSWSILYAPVELAQSEEFLAFIARTRFVAFENSTEVSTQSRAIISDCVRNGILERRQKETPTLGITLHSRTVWYDGTSRCFPLLFSLWQLTRRVPYGGVSLHLTNAQLVEIQTKKKRKKENVLKTDSTGCTCQRTSLVHSFDARLIS